MTWAIDPEDGEKYFFPRGTWEEVTDDAQEN